MKQKFFRSLADLRFSIFLFLLISFCSILGTIIEQDQSIELYKINYPLIKPVFGFLTWDRIIQFGLDHVYRTWWFFLIIFLLGLSLTSCSFLQQLPSLGIARRCQFFRTINQFYRLKISNISGDLSFNKILSSIKKSRYSIFQQRNITYCYKGLIGRIAPIIVHFSIILILIGTIVGSLFGFKAQEITPRTEICHIQNILSNNRLTFVPRISARINDFWITYTRKKTILQFYSDVSIINNQGNEVSRKTISVNYPLIYNNIYFYQTDWNLIGLRFQNSNSKIIEYPLISFSDNPNKIWLTWMVDSFKQDTGIVIVINNLEGYCSIYNEIGKFLGNMELNEITRFSKLLRLSEIISSTGLQIKTDPGIPIIYMGFFSLMLSTLISYITYSQIWIIRKNHKVYVGGNTNRAAFEFELEFLKFIR